MAIFLVTLVPWGIAGPLVRVGVGLGTKNRRRIVQRNKKKGFGRAAAENFEVSSFKRRFGELWERKREREGQNFRAPAARGAIRCFSVL